MCAKAAIIERMGEDALLLPELITRGLAANGRLTYYLKLLHAAHAHAITPDVPPARLRIDREASGVADGSLDHIVQESSTVGSNALHIPRAGSIVEHMFEELRQMLQPLAIAGRSTVDIRTRFEIYKRRLDDLIAHAPLSHDDQLTIAAVEALTRLSGNGHDTAHQLAVDLRGELKRLQATVAEEIVDRARAYAITDADRVLVRAFMKGVNETAHLKFEHPGLGTIATRNGGRLSIQNDLGSSDTHVLVVRITGLDTVVTYTDIHRPRVRFLQDLLRPYGVQWSAAPAATPTEYEISVGRYTANSPESLERYLTYLGSRLVFLIDWNRARKRLARLVKKSDAIGLLKWAADNNVGHHAFLQVGDVGLIDTALERAAPLHTRIGARLDEWLGREAARAFLRSVLHVTSSGLQSGRSVNLIEDEISAELLRNLQTTDPHMLQSAAEHAALISALAERLRRTLMRASVDDTADDLSLTADLAKRWSTQADQIVAHACRRLDRVSERELRRLLTEADGAADALEEAAFLLTLLPQTVDRQTVALLAGLADLVTDTVREYVRCLEEGRDLSATSAHDEVDRFLVAIDRLVELNRQASERKRLLTERLIRGAGDFHGLHVVGDMARGFERTAGSLARCGAIVRDHVLSAHLVR
jgi:uncharacterized protein Yka (UPF0111/DUF47 family)